MELLTLKQHFQAQPVWLDVARFYENLSSSLKCYNSVYERKADTRGNEITVCSYHFSYHDIIINYKTLINQL